MSTVGTVRFWLDNDGYGVIDSPDTPGGCWAHFSAVKAAGYKTLAPGQQVGLEWEPAAQDGYAYRAVRTWPVDQLPVDEDLAWQDSGRAHSSRLTIVTDDEAPRSGLTSRPSPEV